MSETCARCHDTGYLSAAFYTSAKPCPNGCAERLEAERAAWVEADERRRTEASAARRARAAARRAATEEANR